MKNFIKTLICILFSVASFYSCSTEKKYEKDPNFILKMMVVETVKPYKVMDMEGVPIFAVTTPERNVYYPINEGVKKSEVEGILQSDEKERKSFFIPSEHLESFKMNMGKSGTKFSFSEFYFLFRGVKCVFASTDEKHEFLSRPAEVNPQGLVEILEMPEPKQDSVGVYDLESARPFVFNNKDQISLVKSQTKEGTVFYSIETKNSEEKSAFVTVEDVDNFKSEVITRLKTIYYFSEGFYLFEGRKCVFVTNKKDHPFLKKPKGLKEGGLVPITNLPSSI